VTKSKKAATTKRATAKKKKKVGRKGEKAACFLCGNAWDSIQRPDAEETFIPCACGIKQNMPDEEGNMIDEEQGWKCTEQGNDGRQCKFSNDSRENL
jgi:hypothetical protein